MNTHTHGSQELTDALVDTSSRTKAEIAATLLTTFVFAINCLFAVYMLNQFFETKPYSNALHVGYSLLVVTNVMLLGYSTRCFWLRQSRHGCYAFFSAIGVSLLCNILLERLS
jgi:hypothetical protein